MPILKNGEVAFVEVGDNVLLVVNDRGVKHHLIDLLAENKDAIVGIVRSLSIGAEFAGTVWAVAGGVDQALLLKPA